jgi:glycosyl hydrolase family 44
MGTRGRCIAVAAMAAVGATLVGAAPRSDAADQVALRVDAHAGRHPISADIYGMNFPYPDLAKELKLPVVRFGGNSTTRYNYQSKTTNRANDYYYLNTDVGGPDNNELPLEDFVTRDTSFGAKSLVTVPIIGWVTDPNKKGACGFSVKKYGKQNDTQDGCGTGKISDDKAVTGNDPHDTSIEVGPDFVTGEVKHLVSLFGPANKGGVPFYSLDNEPSIWDSTHADVHPKQTTYDELASRGIQYAQAIKAGDAGAQVFGPADWGYIAYQDSEPDIQGGTTKDKDAHGGEPLVPWYLDQFRTYEQQHHQRLLDYLDEHFYPEAQNNAQISLTTAGDSKTQALRFETTRSLWDPTYLDQSYIGKDMGEKMAIIPRLKGYVADHYPGTKVALTEYNWGGLESVNGALAEADVLGIFGEQGLDLATIWSPPRASDAGANAFRMFLNYDGAGAKFGETSVTTTSADREKVSVYAAERAGDHALTILAINKTGGDIDAPLTIAGGPAATKADVWRYSGRAPRVVGAGSLPVNGGAIAATLPANSMSLFVVPGKGIANNEPAGTAPPATAAPGSGDQGQAAASSTGSHKHVNPFALGLGALLAVAGVAVLAARADIRRLRWPVVVPIVGVVIIAGALVFKSSGGGGSGGATAAASNGTITITSPKAGANVHKGVKFSGTATLTNGQRLFLLVFAPGPQQYYDAAEVPSVGGDGTWSVDQYVTGDKAETYTLYAFILPADKATAYDAADKSNLHALPDGVVSQTTVAFHVDG